jgi:hypothetical protein
LISIGIAKSSPCGWCAGRASREHMGITLAAGVPALAQETETEGRRK